MQLSLPFIDIIIFAIIAVFLIYRLKNILGEKTGFDPSENQAKKYSKQNKVSNVLELPTQKNDLNNFDKKLLQIKSLDNNFSSDEFIQGAKIFFEMVIKSFVQGDLSSIKSYVKDNLIKDFQSAITDRIKDEEILIIDIENIQSTTIKDITIHKSIVKIQVLFESLQIKALKDKHNKIIDGDLDKSILVKDLWKFERNMTSDNKNWTLVETTVA